MVATPVAPSRPPSRGRPRPPLRTVRLYRTPRKLLSHPIAMVEDAARAANGDIVRLDFGVFRPYLFLKPEHVQRVLRDNAANYVREGMLWQAIRRLVGNGILGEGTNWATSRKLMNPLFSAKHVESQFDIMAAAITDAVDDLATRAKDGAEVDSAVELTRIVHRAVIRVFFGDRISLADADRLAPAVEQAATSILWRLAMPFAPNWVPLPGDRAFRKATKMIDEVMLPLVEEARSKDTGKDIVTTLARAEYEDGKGLTNTQIRDDVVSMFAAGTETTGVALTWLWVALRDYPEVATRLYDEIDRVVGDSRVQRAHIAELRYTRMVLQELLRLYGVGWLVPRQAARDDVVDGVKIKKGQTVVISPYFSHRMDWLWDRPLEFDPERFATGKAEGHHRYAYFPFGGGAHQCLGSHFFLAEAQLITASILSRWRPEVTVDGPVTPQVSASLRPAQRVTMRLNAVR
ncbi:MAG TPA: cytochrome P450 [Micromonosporaceae bacterium]|jgi:cytochrome P450